MTTSNKLKNIFRNKTAKNLHYLTQSFIFEIVSHYKMNRDLELQDMFRHLVLALTNIRNIISNNTKHTIMDTDKNLGGKVVYIVFVACFLFGTTQNVVAQDEEPKKKGLEKKVFVVPEFDATKKNENAQQNRVKVKSMTPELLDDPWAEQLEERDRELEEELEEQAKKEEEENNKATEIVEENEAMEMTGENEEELKEESKEKEEITSEKYKEVPNPKKTEKSTKKD